MIEISKLTEKDKGREVVFNSRGSKGEVECFLEKAKFEIGGIRI
jgi:hypothetical protein